jgi:hypothetical protein
LDSPTLKKVAHFPLLDGEPHVKNVADT